MRVHILTLVVYKELVLLLGVNMSKMLLGYWCMFIAKNCQGGVNKLMMRQSLATGSLIPDFNSHYSTEIFKYSIVFNGVHSPKNSSHPHSHGYGC